MWHLRLCSNEPIVAVGCKHFASCVSLKWCSLQWWIAPAVTVIQDHCFQVNLLFSLYQSSCVQTNPLQLYQRYKNMPLASARQAGLAEDFSRPVWFSWTDRCSVTGGWHIRTGEEALTPTDHYELPVGLTCLSDCGRKLEFRRELAESREHTDPMQRGQGWNWTQQLLAVTPQRYTLQRSIQEGNLMALQGNVRIYFPSLRWRKTSVRSGWSD